jgi:hypothetical protein
MSIDAIFHLIDDATHHDLKRTRFKVLRHTLVDLLNSVFLSQHTFNSEISTIKYAQALGVMLVNTDQRHTSFYKQLTKRLS